MDQLLLECLDGHPHGEVISSIADVLYGRYAGTDLSAISAVRQQLFRLRESGHVEINPNDSLRWKRVKSNGRPRSVSTPRSPSKSKCELKSNHIADKKNNTPLAKSQPSSTVPSSSLPNPVYVNVEMGQIQFAYITKEGTTIQTSSSAQPQWSGVLAVKYTDSKSPLTVDRLVRDQQFISRVESVVCRELKLDGRRGGASPRFTYKTLSLRIL
jgi:hypothetical protein